MPLPPMPVHTPSESTPGHSSWWVRLILRILSIRGVTWLLLALSLSLTAVVCQQAWRRQAFLHHAAPGGQLLPVGLLAAGGTCLSLLVFAVAHSMATTGRRALSLATGMTDELRRSESLLHSTLAELRASHDELQRTQLELIQAAKLESVGTLAAGVAHEVKNPLQTVLMGLDFLDCRLAAPDPTTRCTLDDMRDAVLRANAIASELLQFASATGFSPARENLEALLARTLRLLKNELTRSQVTVVKHFAGALPPVAVDARKIQQALINLIVNALQAMGRGGTLTITTATGPLARLLHPHPVPDHPLQPHTPVVVVRLADTGPGIPAHDLPRIFDPFFTTKAVGSGTGLGLSVTKKIIDLHRALIHVRNSPHGGLEVTLAFPTAPHATHPYAPPAPPA